MKIKIKVSTPSVNYGSKPKSEVIEADERMGAHGEVVQVLDQAALRLGLSAAYDKGLRSRA